MSEQAERNPNLDASPDVDLTRPTYIGYMAKTREYYLAAGYGNPYRWAHYEDVPFTPLTKPLSESRVGIVTTAAQFDPAKGDQAPGAAYNTGAKFHAVYSLPADERPDLRVSHIAYDRRNARVDDMNAYFPLQRLHEAAAAGRIGEVASRFHAVPTLRSQRKIIERDAPEILALLREDGVDVAVLTAV
jgi:hypothetical protein